MMRDLVSISSCINRLPCAVGKVLDGGFYQTRHFMLFLSGGVNMYEFLLLRPAVFIILYDYVLPVVAQPNSSIKAPFEEAFV